MNGDLVKVATESDVAIASINNLLWRYQEVAYATDFYAQTLIGSIINIKSYLEQYMAQDSIAMEDEKWHPSQKRMQPLPHKEYKVLLEYLKELEQIIQVKSKLWYRHVPATDVSFVDNL